MSEPVRNDGMTRLCPRRACALPAVISFGDYRSRVSCAIVDMSSAGAGLSLTRGEELAIRRRLEQAPDKPIMLILPHERTSVDAAIVWCADGKLGLRFVSAFEPFHGRV